MSGNRTARALTVVAFTVTALALAPRGTAHALEVGECRTGGIALEGPLASLPEHLAARLLEARAAREQAPLSQDDVLWCTGASDPRCSPSSPAPSAPHWSLTQTAVGDLITLPRVPRATASRVRFLHDVGAPREGSASRVERPPR